MDKSIKQMAIELHSEALKQGVNIEGIYFERAETISGDVKVIRVNINAEAVNIKG